MTEQARCPQHHVRTQFIGGAAFVQMKACSEIGSCSYLQEGVLFLRARIVMRKFLSDVRGACACVRVSV